MSSGGAPVQLQLRSRDSLDARPQPNSDGGPACNVANEVPDVMRN